MFDFQVVTKWLNDLLNGWMPGWLATTVECLLVAVFLLVAYSVIAMIYIMYERWVCAWIQCRLGPRRVGPWGLLQVFADVLKILQKEIIKLWSTDRFLFNLAPFLVVIASVLTFACLPWGKGLQFIDFNIGIFFVTANALQAIGAAKSALLINLSRQGFIYIPALFILRGLIGVNGLAWAQPVADVLSTILVFILYFKTTRQMMAKARLETTEE